MKRERIVQAARAAETMAAVTEPVVWISVITVLLSALPYLIAFTISRGDTARSHEMLLFLDICLRVIWIGGAIGLITAPVLMMAGWRADVLRRAAENEPLPTPPRLVTTYTAQGTSKAAGVALKGGETQWNC